jgi:hypothetical protein
MSDTAWSWIIFIVLGGITGTLKYAAVLTPNDIATFDQISPFIYLVVHVFIGLSLAKESVMAGIFSFFCPPYMLYYLFVVSDNFYSRALVAGMAVGMGEATVLFWAEAISSSVTAANGWIRTATQ